MTEPGLIPILWILDAFLSYILDRSWSHSCFFLDLGCILELQMTDTGLIPILIPVLILRCPVALGERERGSRQKVGCFSYVTEWAGSSFLFRRGMCLDFVAMRSSPLLVNGSSPPVQTGPHTQKHTHSVGSSTRGKGQTTKGKRTRRRRGRARSTENEKFFTDVETGQSNTISAVLLNTFIKKQIRRPND